MKKIFIPLFSFIMFFAFSNSVFAYDFSNWQGANLTKFAMKDSSNTWHTTYGSTPNIWQYQPDFNSSPFATLNHISAEFKIPTKTLKRGTATFQVAFGYHRLYDDRPSKYCEWFKGFGNYSLEYSSNNAGSWTNFSVNTFDCFNNDGFVILSYSVNVPNDIDITNLSFGIFGNNSDNIAATVYTAYNVISSEDSSGTIINQNNTIINQNEQTNQNLEDIKDSLTNSDSSGASSEAGDFFSGFNTDTFGLTSIITSPLNLIGSITSSSCSPLGLPLPYINKSLTLPCMSSIYQKHFGSFLTLYQTITFGIVAYWVCVRIFNLVKDFKNPEHDEIEVLDL